MDTTLAPQGTASPLYNPNALPGTAGSLEPSPTPYVPPTAASVSSMMTPQTPLKTGTPPSSGLTLADLQGLADSSTPAIDTAKETGNQEQTTLKSLIDKLGTQGTEQINLENNAGLPAMRSTLNDLTAQMDAVTTRLKSTIVASTNPRGNNTTMFGANAEQNAARREASAQLLGLSAAANAVKGNIVAATTQAQHALKAEFDPINAQIKYWTTALVQNRADMTAAQKQKADTITKTLNEYNLQVKQQQAEKSGVYKIMFDAAKNGANAVTLAKIQAAPDQATAIQMAAGFSAIGQSIKTQVVTANGRRLLIDSKTGNTIRDLGNSATPKSGAGGIYKFTSTQKTKLLGVGETSKSLTKLESDITKYGAQKVLDEGIKQKQITPALQSVLESMFGITATPEPKTGLFGLGFLGL